ncbi:membrane protein insertase YidC [Phragmitibacter flavus]|uniref:Membrane protein insertase YidC n=1 Tax=Phragmitibacter flavus TaxID=2576071 RepID=A0A5R8KII8_9BACT|nr:membrane protein insertase YidC [Phragmitibacter flavus]TLD72051.1 membrane protein insertase YidC [Phragmitibacter flavus]
MDRKAWIVITLCAIGMVLNGWWMIKHPPPQPAPAPNPPAAATATPAAGTTPATAATPGAPVAGTPADTAAPAAAVEEKVVLTNDKVAYTFTTKGGGILLAELHDIKETVTINTVGKAAIGSFGSEAKVYDDLFYRIVDKSDKHIVFEATSPDQVVIRKEYRFTEGPGSNDHLIHFQIHLDNKGPTKHSRDNYYLYTGAAASLRPDEVELPAYVWNNAGSSDYFATSKFRDGPNFIGMGGPITQLPHQAFDRLRWAGVMSRFYATLITTKDDQPAKVWGERFLVDHSKDEFATNAKSATDYAIHGGVSLPPIDLEPGASKSYDFRIYIGAKIFHDLKKIDLDGGKEGPPDRQMRQVMFYGMFSVISRILVGGLRTFHDWTGNWGVAIILLTICVRTVLWPVQARSNRTMKRMGLLSPKLKELQEKYKDEPQKINTEMMKLYREYGVNPLGGCLPLLIQIPIFFGFYAVLRFAAELRSQDFLWVKDLSLPDTIHTLHFGTSIPFIGDHFNINPLPLIMGITMFLQMKLTPQPASADKMQQRIFLLMPFIFLIFCYGFASALALYWSAQNVYSIFQAQISRLWQTDPVLEKVAPADNSSSSGSSSTTKKKSGPPRLGGGGTNSAKKRK